MAKIAEQTGELETIDVLEFDGDKDGVHYTLHLNFLFSTWSCMFGNGCPGLIFEGQESYFPAGGCCTDGAFLHNYDDFLDTQHWVDQLTEEDLEPYLLRDVQRNGWARVFNGNIAQFNGKTRVRDGACILANRGGSSVDGKIGCSLLHLSARLSKENQDKGGLAPAVDHTETMPEVCWQLPFKRHDEFDSEGNLVARQLYPWHIGDWYNTGVDEETMKFWCVDDAKAYSYTGEPVFRTAANELKALLGEDSYNQILPELERRYDLGYAVKMRPARPDGRSLIPLAVKGLKEKPNNA